MRRLLIALAMIVSLPVAAQSVPLRIGVIQVTSDPTGVSCTYGSSPVQFYLTDGKLYCCEDTNPDDYAECPNQGGGGGGTPGGADTQVQYNNAGAFGGDAGLTYDAAGDELTVGSVQAEDSTSANVAYQTQDTDEANPRWRVAIDGDMRWGPGSATFDTRLLRLGVGSLGISNVPLSDADVQLSFQRLSGDESIKWDEGDSRFEVSDDLLTSNQLILSSTGTDGIEFVEDGYIKIDRGAAGNHTLHIARSDGTSLWRFVELGGALEIGNASTDASYDLVFSRSSGNETLGWDNTDGRFEFSEDLEALSEIVVTSTGAALFKASGVQTGSDGAFGAVNFLNSATAYAQISANRIGADDAAKLVFNTTATGGSLTRGFEVSSTQQLWIGSTRDTNLYRSAADTLKTDDSLDVAGVVTLTRQADSTEFQIEIAGNGDLILVEQ